MTWQNLLLVWAGGGLGAMTRYAAGMLPVLQGARWMPTLGVNILGSLLIGVAWALFARYDVARGWYLLAVTGFLGGFTTFSTFSLDCITLVSNGQATTAALYVMATIACGFGGCAAGYALTGRLLALL